MIHLRLIFCTVFLLIFAHVTFATHYSAHGNDRDREAFIKVFPAQKDSRIDSCVLCHRAGFIEGKHGAKRFVDACAYCHSVHGLKPPHGPVPLNSFGLSYLKAGRSASSLLTIGAKDDDGDGVSNIREIIKGTLPGNSKDYPGLARAPMRVFTALELTAFPQKKFTLLMNTHKSGDFYATYCGVTIKTILSKVGLDKKAKAITVFSADGYKLTIPLQATEGRRALGPYPKVPYYPNLPWVTYPKDLKLPKGALLPGTPEAMVALTRNGTPLGRAKLVRKPNSNRWVLDDEGPFRFIAPQALPSVPDQPETSSDKKKPYPFNTKLDHNAGDCVRTIVAIRVDPLPAGTTDAAWLNDRWLLVGQKKLVVFGAIKGRP